MLRIVVLGGGMSGKIIGGYIEEEIPVEVVYRTGFDFRDFGDIRERLSAEIERFPEKVSVIVLMDVEIEMSYREYLANKYPEYEIVGYGDGLDDMINKMRKVLVLVAPEERRTERYQRIKAACQNAVIQDARMGRWRKIDEDSQINAALKEEIDGFYDGVVVIYDTMLIRFKENIEKIVGWRAEVVDMRKLVLRDVCTALKLKGKDGKATRDIYR